MSYKPLKIHAPSPAFYHEHATVCGTWGKTGADVNCLRCLYRLGLYVPFVKRMDHIMGLTPRPMENPL